MDEAGDAESLMSVQEFLEEEPFQARAQPARTTLRWRAAQALATTAVMAVGAVALWSWAPSANSVATEKLQVIGEYQESNSGCVCLFDVDRTLTARQESTPDECPGTKSPVVQVSDGHGGTKSQIPFDSAYGTGPLVLSEVANNLDKTFCSKDRCHIGIVTAGTGSLDGPDEERGQLFARLSKASHGQSGDGQWSGPDVDPPISPLIFSCPDPKKVECAKSIVDMLNGKGANIPADNVYFFDDHRGNADEMYKYGFNGREVSCLSRDMDIDDGIVGLCGARLNEIVKEKGVKNCWQLDREDFYQ
eukprot:gb/GFBE01066127.1/.p1 GENE.gb/GFBE01066127.1/~~gb/GFBE01066127.1/.p1  ORF type:complete len:304 (+),score=59.96 gb/GFBE01066127.1/:1-912(+)